MAFSMYNILFIVLLMIIKSESARILVVFPTPSISHQIVFRPLFQELAKRGHDVVVITTDPAFSKGEAPKNYLEIDVHDLSYSKNLTLPIGKKADWFAQLSIFHEVLSKIINEQFRTPEVQNVIKDKENTFDLLFIELYAQAALGYSHLIKAPVIHLSSFGGQRKTFEEMGAPSHPNLYPIASRQMIHNISIWDNISELYTYWFLQKVINYWEIRDNEMLKGIFDLNIPSLDELKSNVHLLFLNIHPLWDFNRPVPKNVIHLAGIHQNPKKELPKDMKKYLDNSKYGVVYMSFGTNAQPSSLPQEKIKIIFSVLSQLPYDVLLKWDKDYLDCSKNIRIKKWFPQSDLLGHPNIKAFVTQAGLQSTDEAIDAGVPLVGIPLLGDQWVNAKMYEIYKIGIKLEMETLTEDNLKNAIESVIKDMSYRENMVKLRSKLRDAAQTALQRAVWWTEYVLRHGGAHLRAPAANMHWTEYYEIELGVIVLCIFFSSIILIYHLILLTIRRILSLVM